MRRNKFMAISFFVAIHGYFPAWLFVRSYSWLLLICALLLVAISAWLIFVSFPHVAIFWCTRQHSASSMHRICNCQNHAENMQGISTKHARIMQRIGLELVSSVQEYARIMEFHWVPRVLQWGTPSGFHKNHRMSLHFTGGTPEDVIEFHRMSSPFATSHWDFIDFYRICFRLTWDTP